MKFTAKTALVTATLIGSALLSTSSHASIIEINDYSNDIQNPTFIGTLSEGVTTVAGSVGVDLNDVLDAFYFLPEAGFEITRLVNMMSNITPTLPPAGTYDRYGYGYTTADTDRLTDSDLAVRFDAGVYSGAGSFYTLESWNANPQNYTATRTFVDSDFWDTHPWWGNMDVSTQNVLSNNVTNTSRLYDPNDPFHLHNYVGRSSFDWQWDITISPIAGFQGNQASISNATTGSKTINANAPATASILGLGLIAMMLRKRRN